MRMPSARTTVRRTHVQSLRSPCRNRRPELRGRARRAGAHRARARGGDHEARRLDCGLRTRLPSQAPLRAQAAGGAGEGGEDLQIIRRRSEEHTSELQSLMRISYAVFYLKKKN